MRQFNQYLRNTVASMYEGGTVREVDRLNGGYRIPPEARPILTKLVRLVMLTDYTHQDTKLYLSTGYGMRTIQRNEGCASNKNTSRSRIQNDLTKVKIALGIDFFDVLLKEGEDLTRKREALEELVERVRGRSSLLGGYVVPLPSPTGEIDHLDDESLAKLTRLTKTLGKAGLERLRQMFTPDMVNYLNYLDNHRDELDPANKAVYDELRGYTR